jgi:dynein heavy chain, axonemal
MAGEGSLLFFAVSDLDNIDSMYQYSLTYFTDLFKMAIENSPKNDSVEVRLITLRDYFRLSLFRNISRSLFQKDRLLFAALIALRLQKLRTDVLRFLLSTTAATTKFTLEKPRDKWVTTKIWENVCKLA